MWKNTGIRRPDFAVEPGPGQESVWDYPRPPDLRKESRRVRVLAGDNVVADSTEALRVCETASPPTFYIPPTDVNFDVLTRNTQHTWCEWKGRADYFDLTTESQLVPSVGWAYPNPNHHFAAIAEWLSFYANRVQCHVGSEAVQPQAGSFYGGWVTSEIVGPFKGDPGTGGW